MYHVLEQLGVFFGGLRVYFYLSLFMKTVHLLHRSPRLLQITKQAIVAGHMNGGGVTPPRPQPQVKKHMTTTLVLFAHI